MASRFMSFIGLFVMLGFAWLLSNNKKKMDFRVILGGISLQFILAACILKSRFGQMIFVVAKDVDALSRAQSSLQVFTQRGHPTAVRFGRVQVQA